MQEVGNKKTRTVFDLFQTGQLVTYVIINRTEREKLAKPRAIRDLIKVKMANWRQEMGVLLSQDEKM